MATYQTEDKVRLRKLWVDHAIQLAMQNRWADAVAINRNVLELFPNDVDTYNRLGRALRELGHYKEARESYRKAVDIDPNNTIAQRNLSSLNSLNLDKIEIDPNERVDPRLFIAETGKSSAASLVGIQDRTLIAKMAVGDQVYLQPEGRALYVKNGRGETLGRVEPKTAQRLIDLLAGGNKYAAALMAVDETNPRIIIHETYQDPSQTGKMSFSTRGDTNFRGYTKESMVKFSDFDDDDDDNDSENESTGEGESDGEEPIEPSEYEDEQQSE